MTSTDTSIGYVAIEQAARVLDGKRGSFVLQHAGSVNRGAASLTVTAVPDSGTEGLVGLEGKFRINIEDVGNSCEFADHLPARDGE